MGKRKGSTGSAVEPFVKLLRVVPHPSPTVQVPLRHRLRLGAVLAGSVLLCAALVLTRDPSTGLGVSERWPWLLMGLNLVALAASSRGRPIGWALAVAMQPPTIVFCWFTGQRGFVAGSVVGMALQFGGWRRCAASAPAPISSTSVEDVPAEEAA